MALKFNEIPSAFQAELTDAVSTIGLFQGTTEEVDHADVILTVEYSNISKSSRFIFLNAALLGLLPLPAEKNETTLMGRMRVGSLPEVALPPVRFGSRSWAGLPLLPLSFIQFDGSEKPKRMAEDLVVHLSREYSALHARTWATANKDHSAEDFRQFMESFPKSRYSKNARNGLESKLFGNLDRNATADDYLLYLQSFPNSARAQTVKDRGAEPTWKELKARPEEQRIEEYLVAFAGGPFVANALSTLEDIHWNRLQTKPRDLQAHHDFLTRFSKGEHADYCREVVAWGQAEEKGTPGAVAEYLRIYPGGQYRGNAKHAERLFQNEELMAVANSIPTWIRDQIYATVHRIPEKTDVKMKGEMDHNLGGTILKISYEGSYADGVLSYYEVLDGTVYHEGNNYRFGANGRWYPAFPLAFQ